MNHSPAGECFGISDDNDSNNNKDSSIMISTDHVSSLLGEEEEGGGGGSWTTTLSSEQERRRTTTMSSVVRLPQQLDHDAGQLDDDDDDDDDDDPIVVDVINEMMMKATSSSTGMISEDNNDNHDDDNHYNYDGSSSRVPAIPSSLSLRESQSWMTMTNESTGLLFPLSNFYNDDHRVLMNISHHQQDEEENENEGFSSTAAARRVIPLGAAGEEESSLTTSLVSASDMEDKEGRRKRNRASPTFDHLTTHGNEAMVPPARVLLHGVSLSEPLNVPSKRSYPGPKDEDGNSEGGHSEADKPLKQQEEEEQEGAEDVQTLQDLGDPSVASFSVASFINPFNEDEYSRWEQLQPGELQAVEDAIQRARANGHNSWVEQATDRDLSAFIRYVVELVRMTVSQQYIQEADNIRLIQLISEGVWPRDGFIPILPDPNTSWETKLHEGRAKIKNRGHVGPYRKKENRPKKKRKRST